MNDSKKKGIVMSGFFKKRIRAGGAVFLLAVITLCAASGQDVRAQQAPGTMEDAGAAQASGTMEDAGAAQASGTMEDAGAETTREELQLVFTHDLHSHLESFSAELDGQEQEVGGFARIKTFMDEARAEDEDTLVLDGGDFSMGTLYQTVYESQAAELRMLGFLGVDVTTMGNHEFDYRTRGLNQMLQSALDSGDVLPYFVLCNVDWDATLADTTAEGHGDLVRLKDTFKEYGIFPYIMLERKGLNIAVIGVFGEDALACAPTCQLVFRDPVEAVKETVADIKASEKADLIICVSHSGTWEDASKSEDEILAKEVPELDLIVSGHTHSTLSEPIVHGDTSIVSCGEYGIRAGKLTLVRQEGGRWAVTDYQVPGMTKDIPEDGAALEKIQKLGETIDSDYLAQFGYTRDQVLIHNPWRNPQLRDIYAQHQEHPYCNLLSDSYIYALNRLPQYAEDPVQVSVVPTGVIRDVFAENRDLTVAEVFNVFSLGIGPDGVPGYPLVDVYLTGEELKTAAEVDASISPMMDTAQLFMSGLSYTYNPRRLILNKVTEIALMDLQGNVEELADDKLYRVVADLYSGQMLGAVSDQSFGILSITPKDAQGNPIEDLEEHIIYDEKGQEVKAWEAVAQYLEYLAGQNDGQIPEYYDKAHGRKLVEEDGSIGALIRHPNKIAVALAVILLIVILLLVLIVVWIVKLVKKRRRKGRTRAV